MAMLTDYVLLDIFLIFSSLLTALYLWMKKKHTYWEKRGIRSLPRHWFFGHFEDAVFMRKPPGIVLGDLYRQVTDEDVLGIYVFHKPFLLVRNPELIKQIFIRDFHIFPNHHFTAKSNIDRVGSSSLFTIDNPEWKYLRTKMSPVFTSGKIKSLFLLMLESADAMRMHLRDQFAHSPDKMLSLEIKDTLYKYTTDVISSVAFGIRTDCFNKSTSEFYKFYDSKEELLVACNCTMPDRLTHPSCLERRLMNLEKQKQCDTCGYIFEIEEVTKPILEISF